LKALHYLNKERKLVLNKLDIFSPNKTPLLVLSEFTKKSLSTTLETDTDFWWDIENHVIWSFDIDYMACLIQYLTNSFVKMGLE
jgi:hypothetical protein